MMDKCYVFWCYHTENWLRGFFDLQEICGVDGQVMSLDLLFLCISTMLSYFSSSMLIDFPRIRLCQKALVKLMWWIKINQYKRRWGFIVWPSGPHASLDLIRLDRHAGSILSSWLMTNSRFVVTEMPYWSIGEWRAHIGSSWCALGRPFKMRSPFRGKTHRGLMLSQGVATLFLLLMSIVVNLGLRTLVARGHHLPLLSKWYDQFNF